MAQVKLSLWWVGIALSAAGAGTAETIRGTVFDATGTVVTQARVMLMDQDYVKQAETKSGSRGEFSFECKPGFYFVQVKRPMFQMYQQHVDLKPGVQPQLYAVLDVARGVEQIGIGTGIVAPPPDVALREGGKVEGFKRLSGWMPRYPEAAAARNASGTVALFARIRLDGSPGDVATLGAADPDLEKAARDAVASWRYAPMKLDGMPVETSTIIQFDLRRP
jgi:TonB family protein